MPNDPIKNNAAFMALQELPPETMLSPEQAASLLANSEATLARLRADGIGPAYVKGAGANGSVHYRKQDLLDWQAAVRAGGKVR